MRSSLFAAAGHVVVVEARVCVGGHGGERERPIMDHGPCGALAGGGVECPRLGEWGLAAPAAAEAGAGAVGAACAAPRARAAVAAAWEAV